MTVTNNMNLLDAIMLGVIQGLTEFLPVSSSGHLEIGKEMLNVNLKANDSMMMTIVLHAATALSTIVVFHKDVAAIFVGLFKFKWNEDYDFAVKILVSMIPAVVVGLTMEDAIENLFNGNMLLVGSMLVLTGVLLFLAGRAKSTVKNVGYLDSIIIGIAQAIAILPGVSRSGATISTSVLLGVDRVKAARFSFLMVVPLILGKMAKDALDGGLTASVPPLPLIVSFVAAFVTGVIACKWMIALVKDAQLWWFSIYCFTVGVIAMGYHFQLSPIWKTCAWSY